MENIAELTVHPNLQAVLQVLPGLHRMLGKRHEVILHDLTIPDQSIIAIFGNITNRSVGGPITNYVLQVLKQYGDNVEDRIRYKSISNDGSMLRSSTFFIRDENNTIIGCLCINQKVEDYIKALDLLHDMGDFEDLDQTEEQEEYFAHDVTEVMENIIYSTLKTFDKPVNAMQKDDKMLIVSKLDEKGVFAIKGAVQFVADYLEVSSFTIYNYIKEMRVGK